MTKSTANGNAKAQPTFDPAAAFSSFAMPTFDMPAFDMPKFDMPKFDMPKFDVDAMAASQRRNVEALTKANKLASDGARDFAARQAEILKNAVDAYADAMSGLMAINDPKTSVTKQAEIAKSTIETSSSNLRELADIATKAQAKSLDVINKRVVESIDEFQSLAAKV